MPTDGKTVNTAYWVRRIGGEKFQVFAINCEHLGWCVDSEREINAPGRRQYDPECQDYMRFKTPAAGGRRGSRICV